MELTTTLRNILVGVFYRPPNSGLNPLCELKSSLLSIRDSSSIILTGDFNLPDIFWLDSTESAVARSKEAKFIADIQQDSALHQLVQEPTRGSNTLDLLFTNVGDMIGDVRVIDGIIGSDHDAI